MDQELKQRMIGASVIIALAVIFVPMLFDGNIDQKHNKNISITIPEEPATNLEVKKFALDKPVSEAVELPAGDVELVVEDNSPALVIKEPEEQIQKPINQGSDNPIPLTQSTEQPVVNQTTPDKPTIEKVDKPVVKTVDLNENKIKPADTVEQSKVMQAYRVKLGSFSQKANAERVKSSLLQQKINALVEYDPALKLYRVWSQSIYQSETKANEYVNAVNKLKMNIGTPKIITISAPEVAQMVSQGQLGWVVQLGSFSEKKNAIELRNKVTAAGFRAFVDQVINSKGKHFYRLRVGPLMEKPDAEATKQRIKSRLKLDGLIKSHELSDIVNS